MALTSNQPERATVECLTAAREELMAHRPIAPGVVRQPILASWKRCRVLGVRVEGIDLGSEPDGERDSPLRQAAEPILQEMTDRLANEPMSLILCDEDGVVLERHTGDSHLQQHLDRVWLAPGFSYSEDKIGTNGIGTALESRGPMHVIGGEHWVEDLNALACAGVPIRHPFTGKLLGVLDLTGWRRHGNALMTSTASMIAERIEQALLERAGRREFRLFGEYLTACQRNRGMVMAVHSDLLMLNERARLSLDPEDQTTLICIGTDALRTGRRSSQLVNLPSGAVARLRCRPSDAGERDGAGVLLVQFVDQESESLPRTTASSVSAPSIVGDGALWAMCRARVDLHHRHQEWLVLSGEPGSGKRTLARAIHRARMPAGHLRILDATDDHPDWLDDVAMELEQDEGGTVILARLNLLAPSAMLELADIVQTWRESPSAQRPWVVGTVHPSSGEPEGSPELKTLIESFPRTVEVPPLRHHAEDVPELFQHFMSRVSRRGELTCSSAAMRMLIRHPWPGNVRQLQDVVRKIVTLRRTGVIEVSDLPSEIWSTARRILTPLEAIECDAIVSALLEQGGSKPKAAKVLGVSRATIYRKIREYGIAVP